MSCQNFSNTSEGSIAIGVQSACGTAQTTLKSLRFASDTLNQTAASVISTEIRPNRQIVDLIRTTSSIGGDIVTELSYSTYDDLFQGLFQSATGLDGAGTEITQAKVKKYFTIEKNTPDSAGTNFYTQMIDQQVSGMTLNIAQGAVVGGNFTFMGSSVATPSSTSLDSSPYVAATTTPIFNSLSNVSNVSVDGTTAGYVQSVVLTVTNNLREQRAIGSVAPAGIASGQFAVTGTMKLYFASNALFLKFLSDQTFAFSVTLDDLTGTTHGNQYTFRLPKCKFTNITKNITGNNQDVLLECGFQALYDSTLGGTMGMKSQVAV